MRFTTKSFVASLGVTALASAGFAFAADSSDVISLTKADFASSVDGENLMLVEFFAPWCGHCQALAPHYEAAATELKNESIKLAKVDCTVEEDLCAEQSISGYPTLKVFRNGSPTDYGGPRKTDGIVSYMKRQALPAVVPVSADDFASFKTKDRVVFVAFVDESASDVEAQFTKLAEENRDSYLFGLVKDAEVAKEAGVSVPGAILYRQFDEPEVKYSGALDKEDLAQFLKAQSVPLIDEVGPENFMTYAEAGIPLAYYFTEPEGADKDKDLDALKAVAKEFKGKLNFVWIDAVKFVNHARGLNLQGDDWPKFAIQDLQKNTKYPLEDLGKDHVGSISKFVKDFVGGKIQPSIKSEPVPKEQDGPVFVLVADEFDKVVSDKKKDLLVEFYAPWCGHCKKLAPTYDKLGEKYASHKDKIVIAKMDATANDVPPSAGFQIQSFPTIKFKAAGSAEWIDFEGDRSLEGFVDFIDLNAANKVKVDLAESNETVAEEPPKAEAAHAPHEEL